MNNPWVQAALVVAVCSIMYIIRENVQFSQNTIYYLNLILTGLFVMFAYMSAKNKKIYKPLIAADVVFLIIINHLFDIPFSDIPGQLLSRRDWIPTALFGIGLIILIGYTFLFVISRIDRVVQQTQENDPDSMDKDGEPALSEAGATNDAAGDGSQPRGYRNSDGQNSHSGRIVRNQAPREPKERKPENTITYFFVAIIAFTIILAAGFVWVTVTQRQMLSYVDTRESIAEKINTIILLALYLVVFIILVFSVLMMVAHSVIMLKNSIKNHNSASSNNVYLLYITALAIVLIISTQSSAFTIDSVASLFVNGNIFAFPLLLIILIPALIFLIRSFIAAVEAAQHIPGENAAAQQNNPGGVVINDIRDAAFQIWSIASGIIKGLLNLLEFITTDFLASLLSVVEGDDDTEDSECAEDVRTEEE